MHIAIGATAKNASGQMRMRKKLGKLSVSKRIVRPHKISAEAPLLNPKTGRGVAGIITQKMCLPQRTECTEPAQRGQILSSLSLCVSVHSVLCGKRFYFSSFVSWQ